MLLLWKAVPLLNSPLISCLPLLFRQGLPSFLWEICVFSISQLNEETQTVPFQVASSSNLREAVLAWVVLVRHMYK